jgi:NAD(P)-dependent dehydrogenase (short-subunit alcohol dehydrogenase family)
MEKRFEGKVVLITGGNSGIGLAAARRLASEGAEVVLTGRDGAKLEKAVKEIGPSAFGMVADISNIREIDAMYRQVKEKYRRLDGLFANAGIALLEPIEQVTESSVDTLLNTNLKGTFFTLQKAIPLLVAGSAMVVNASVSGSSRSARGRSRRRSGTVPTPTGCGPWRRRIPPSVSAPQRRSPPPSPSCSPLNRRTSSVPNSSSTVG